MNELGLFDFAKNLVTGSINKFSGRTDFLEAVCAGAALVAYADGDASDSEVMAASRAVSGNANLTQAFQSAQIERTMNTMLTRAGTGRVGRLGLYKEIDDIASDAAAAEVVLATVIDVADAEGGISDVEKGVINNVAQRLRLDPNKYI